MEALALAVCQMRDVSPPTLKKAVCMLRIKADAVDKNLEADVRGRRVALSVTPLPFYKRAK